MIKAILFDSGGVVINHKPLVKKLIHIFKPNNKEKFWNDINITVIPSCKNKISEEFFWKNFAKTAGKKGMIFRNVRQLKLDLENLLNYKIL